MFSQSRNNQNLTTLKARLASRNRRERLVALSETLKYGQKGLDLLVQQSLQDRSEEVRQSAYWVLHQCNPYLKENTDQIIPTETITCLAIDPNDRFLVGGAWQYIWIWNLKTGCLIHKIKGHTHWILSLTISANGKTLATSGSDRQIKVWQIETGESIHTFEGHKSWVSSIVFASDCKTLVSGSYDRTIKIWDLESRTLKHTFKGHTGSICSLAIDPNDRIIASGGVDNTIKLWSLEKLKLLETLTGHLDWVQALSFDCSEQKLVSGGRDGCMKIWKIEAIYKNKKVDDFFKDSLISIIEFITLIVLAKITNGLALFAAPSLFFKPKKKLDNGSKLLQSNETLKYPINKLISFMNEKLIINCNDCGNVEIWNLKSGLERSLIKKDIEFIPSIAYSKSSPILAIGLYNWVEILDSRNHKILCIPKGSLKSRLSKIRIEPNYVKIEIGQVCQFRVIGFDQDDCQILIQDEIRWSTSAGIIDSRGTLKASKITGEFNIVAKVTGFESSSKVFVFEPLKLTTLKIYPQTQVSLFVNQSISFQAQGFDQFNKEIELGYINWSSTGGTIDKNGLFFTGKEIGNHTITVSVDGLEATKTVRVKEQPKLNSLAIFASSRILHFRENVNLSVKGYDQYGEIIKTGKIRWETSSGYIKNSIFYADKNEETVTVTAIASNIRKCLTIDVIAPPKLTQIKILPDSVQIHPNESQIFQIQGFDQRGNSMNVDCIQWEATGGYINDYGKFSVFATSKGYYNVAATVQDLKASANVFVPAIICEIKVFPELVEMKPDECEIFAVLGVDQQGQIIEISNCKWQCTRGGSIDVNGLFWGGYSHRQVTVTATVVELHSEAVINLIPVLRRLEISPKSCSLNPDESLVFKLQGFDQFNCLIDPGEIYWTATGGSITQAGKYTAGHYSKGNYKVTATSWIVPKWTRKPKMVFYSIGVSTKVLSYIMKFMASDYADFIFEYLAESQSIGIQQNTFSDEDTINTTEIIQEQQPTNFDINLEAYIRKFVFKTISQIFSTISQSCLKEYSSKLNISAKVFVNPVLRDLELVPEMAKVKPGDAFEFIALGRDQTGDEIEISKPIYWTATGGGEIDSSGIFIADSNAKGLYQVQVTLVEQKISKFSTVHILAVLRRLSIEPKNALVEPERPLQFTVLGYDQCDEKINIEPVSWQSDIGGSINKDGVFIGSYNAKCVKVTATINKIFDCVTVQLKSVLRRIEIQPQEVILNVNDDQKFVAIGYDQFNQKIEIEGIEWSTSSESATIDQKGLLKFSENSTYQRIRITAKYKNIEQSIWIKIHNPCIQETFIDNRPIYMTKIDIREYEMGIERIYKNAINNQEYSVQKKVSNNESDFFDDLDKLPDLDVLDFPDLDVGNTPNDP